MLFMHCDIVRASQVEAVVAEVGAARQGVVSTVVLARAGISQIQLRPLRDRGTLVPVGRGVDRLRDHPLTWACRCRAALDLGGPGAVLGPRPSARLHRWYAYRDDDAVDVYVRRGRDHRTDVGRVLQTGWLPTNHVTEVDGLPVLTLGRTFFGLCADPDHGLPYRHPYHRRKMRRVYNDAIGRRGLTFAQEAAVLTVTAKRGRTGTTLVRSILLEFPPEHEPTRSDAEFLFLELCNTHGIPVGDRQVTLTDERGFIGVVDFCWPAAGLVVEIDSAWHDGPLDRGDDAERDERLATAGWTVRRYRYRDMIERPAVIARQLRQLGAAVVA